MAPQIAHRVETVDLADEICDSFIPYALAVATERALPDARDGLKPVQRRVLWAMHQLGLKPGAPHRKSASIVGEVMGKYHPHGDSSIYQALVRLARPWQTNLPLIDPRGNFGTPDDPPAAYRYTEARLSAAGLAMVESADRGAVDFRAAFDGARDEPVTLPGWVPNLLVNGCDGIAVGLATCVPPHNLAEIADAVLLVLERRAGGLPAPTLEELTEIVTGPDYPSGGRIGDTSGVLDAYRTGRGSFTLTGVCHTERQGHRRALVVTELPHNVGSEQMVAAVRKAVLGGKLAGVVRVDDLTDSDTGLRVRVLCRKGANLAQVERQMQARTPLARQVRCRMTVLDGGLPVELGLVGLLDRYADHITDVTRRTLAHDKAAAETEARRLEGAAAAASRAGGVVRCLAAGGGAPDLAKLLNIGLDQAKAAMAVTLAQTRPKEQKALARRLAGHRRTAAEAAASLASPALLAAEAASRLDRATRPLRTPRRTRVDSLL